MDIVLFIGGLVLLFKKEVKISKKKILTGSKIKILAVLYLLPFFVSFFGGFLIRMNIVTIQTVSSVGIPFVVIAVLATLYLIFIYKDKKNINI